MSLVNQALKKAQRDRSGATPQAPAAVTTGPRQHAHQMATAQKSIKPGLIIGILAAFAVLMGLVVGLTVVLLNKEPSASQVTSTVPVAPATAPATTPTSAATEPTPAAPAVPAPVAQRTLQPAPRPTLEPPVQATAPTAAPSEQTDTLAELRLAREAAEAKARAEAEAARKVEEARQAAELAERKAAERKAAMAKAEPNPAIIDWLEQATISGVRLADSGSKVLLNGRSYGVGEHVNYKLNLKVMAIRENLVLFLDENGKKYLKRL